MTFGLLKVSKTQKIAKGSKLATINKKGIFNSIMAFIGPLLAFVWPLMAFRAVNGCPRLFKFENSPQKPFSCYN